MEGDARAASELGPPVAPYVIPRYRAQGDTAFFHFLHGTVPGHQIDFMYCPEVPQGPLAQTHFGHLARLMKYIEPREGAPYAFALGNLSRDDVQHEPGHGGIAILFALRVAGVIDHAGRDMLPYGHGIVAVDRALDRSTLTWTMIALHKRFLEREGAADRRADFYRAYVRLMHEQPEAVEEFLHRTIQELDDIPQPPKSAFGFDFTAEDSAPRRIAIVHDEDEPFGTLAQCAASIAAALYRSDIKWTSITSGREIDIVGGTTIRLVPRSEAPPEGRALTIDLDKVPDDEDAMMAQLFGAKRRTHGAAQRRKGWREKLAEQRPGLRSEPPPNGASSVDSQDRSDDFDVDLDVDDAAATIALPGLESDRDPAETSPGRAVRFPSSPPRDASPRSTGAHAVRGGPGASFDPRRSSPVGGVAAAPVAFDARRSSPVGGVPAATAAAFDPRRSSPVTGLASASAAASFAPAPASVGVPPSAREPPALAANAPLPLSPDIEPWPASMSPSSNVGFRVARDNRERKGRWIIAAAAFAAIAVIVLVAVTAGIHMSEETSGSGESTQGPSETTGVTSASTPAPAPSPPPSSTVKTATAEPTGSAAPPKNPSKGRRK